MSRSSSHKHKVSSALVRTAVAMGVLHGCVTSYIGNPEIVQQNNAKLAKQQAGVPDPPGAPPADEDRLRRLWRDRPEYVALVGARHTKTIRIISLSVPKYPYWEAWAKKRAEVSIAFIVGIDGKVEAARVYASSDSRFDQPALDAIRQSTFIPAEGPAGPERAMEIQPFHFAVPSKQ